MHPRIEAARRGENPTVILRMPSGWAVLADWQFLPGYTILLADPQVPDLHTLGQDERQLFLRDMSLIGESLMEVTDGYRINYQILGNYDPILHAHVTPRYEWEEPRLREGPTAHYDKSGGPMFDPVRDESLMGRIRQAIKKRLA
ncbi:HIT family protein [Candidatus Latescibacterota bacterium]